MGVASGYLATWLPGRRVIEIETDTILCDDNSQACPACLTGSSWLYRASLRNKGQVLWFYVECGSCGLGTAYEKDRGMAWSWWERYTRIASRQRARRGEVAVGEMVRYLRAS